MRQKDELYLAACEGKEKLELDIARFLVSKSKYKKLGYYRCKWCGSYHVGRKPERKKRRSE